MLVSSRPAAVCFFVGPCLLLRVFTLWVGGGGLSSVLKSPDGNWLALQSAQLSRPGLLARRKSLVFSALEKESGVKSAYEGLDSDNETKPEPEPEPQPDSSWGAVLQEIHRKMTDSNLHSGGDQTSLAAIQKGDKILFHRVFLFYFSFSVVISTC